jgi:hypothetical protein
LWAKYLGRVHSRRAASRKLAAFFAFDYFWEQIPFGVCKLGVLTRS